MKLAPGLIDGFVYKDTDLLRKTFALATLGLINKVRKTVVYMKPVGRRAVALWSAFKAKHEKHGNDSGLFGMLGDEIERSKLEVYLDGPRTTFSGTLTVHRYCVFVFDPQRRHRSISSSI